MLFFIGLVSTLPDAARLTAKYHPSYGRRVDRLLCRYFIDHTTDMFNTPAREIHELTEPGK